MMKDGRTFKTTDQLTVGMIVVLGCGVIKLKEMHLNSLGWNVWSYDVVYGTPSFPYLSGSKYTKWEVVLPL